MLVDSSSGITYSSGNSIDVSSRGGIPPYSLNTVSLTHSVNPVNDAPTLTLSASGANYVENNANLAALVSSASAADVDSDHYNAGSLTISLDSYVTGDILDVMSTDVTGVGQFNRSGN